MRVKPDMAEPDAQTGSALGASITRLETWLADLRADTTRRRRAFTGALVVGFGLTWIHWTGLVLTGALVGLTRRHLSGALVSGVLVGILAIGLTVLAAPAVALNEFIGLTPVNVATVGLAFVLPVWGSLARYVI